VAEGNGVTRREFEELKAELRETQHDLRDTRRALRKEFEDLDKGGSRALGLLILRVSTLEKRSDEHESNWKWLWRGVAFVVFGLFLAVLSAAATGVLGGG
jgi:hypothetical protein